MEGWIQSLCQLNDRFGEYELLVLLIPLRLGLGTTQ